MWSFQNLYIGHLPISVNRDFRYGDAADLLFLSDGGEFRHQGSDGLGPQVIFMNMPRYLLRHVHATPNEREKKIGYNDLWQHLLDLPRCYFSPLAIGLARTSGFAFERRFFANMRKPSVRSCSLFSSVIADSISVGSSFTKGSKAAVKLRPFTPASGNLSIAR